MDWVISHLKIRSVANVPNWLRAKLPTLSCCYRSAYLSYLVWLLIYRAEASQPNQSAEMTSLIDYHIGP